MGRAAAKGLTGRSARVVVTMGMPALVYRYYFRSHSVKNLERNILGFVGIAPIRAAYAHAVGHGYRFFSYGDAMLVERHDNGEPARRR